MTLVRQAGAAGRRARQVGLPLLFLLLATSTAWGQGGRSGFPTNAPAADPDLDFSKRLLDEGGPRYTPTGPQRLVAAVKVEGSQSVSMKRIQTLLRTRKDRIFDPDVVKADVRRLVSSGLFRNVRTLTEDTPAGVVVTFQVFERSTIRYVKYIGNRGISDKRLGKECGVQVGDTLNAYAVEEGRRKIEEYYHSKGFPKTTVSIFEGDQPNDSGVVFVINEGQLERIAAVKFVGNDPNLATDARLKTQIQSKPGYFWYLLRGRVDRRQIDEDVERLTAYYRSLGYFKARISRELQYDDSGRWLTLTFVIDEGPQYQVESVTINGNRLFPEQELLENLRLKPGESFDLRKMTRDVNELRDLYGAHGYIFADIQADPRFREEPGKLDLVYNVEEGGAFRVGEINVHIEGDYPHTKQSVVLNRLSVRPGDLIDYREVRNSERRLKSSQLFETDPAQGVEPRIVIRPPELDDIPSLSGDSADSVRGQSPDNRKPAPRSTPPHTRW